MATKKTSQRTFTATDAQRSRALDLLLGHEDPIVRRAALAAIERVMRVDLSKWDRITVQQHVVWSIKFAADQLRKPIVETDLEWWTDRALGQIAAMLGDPRAQGVGKPAGLTEQVVSEAIVAWAALPGRPPKGKPTKATGAKKKEVAILALLKAIQLAPNARERGGGIEAVSKLIDRKVGRTAEPTIDLGYFGPDPKPG